MPELAISVNTDLSKGFALAQVAEKFGRRAAKEYEFFYFEGLWRIF